MDLVLSFYRTERGAEVDCIIETPAGKTVAVEIKSTENPSSTMLTGLHSFIEKEEHRKHGKIAEVMENKGFLPGRTRRIAK